MSPYNLTKARIMYWL